ncbi:B-cell receptor CD22-like [Spea bombifrons]|uniref:B-cell receptor CD22-like n=1 Tax=Spea bombifrons TaxID=233779 RepID=UPI00234BDB30|nr:B-cell receptor CD22-like [Spea bombifrons]
MYLIGRILLFGIFIGCFLRTVGDQHVFSLPGKMTAVKDSCVVIPCTYSSVNSKDEVIWYQYRPPNHIEIYNSQNPRKAHKSFQGRTALVGDLAKGNCSLKIEKIALSDSNMYFPWISSGKDTNSSVLPNTNILIQVLTKAKGEVKLTPEQVTEGDAISITCSVKHTCPSSHPTFKWDVNGDIRRKHEALTHGEWRTSSVLTYSPTSEDDGKSFTCTTGPYKNTFKSAILIVMYAPKMAAVNGSHENGQVQHGEDVTLECVSTSNPPVLWYTWYKDNQLIVNLTDPNLVVEGMSEAKSGFYHCEASNHLGKAESEPVSVNCVGCPSVLPFILGGVIGASVLISAVIATTIMILKKSKNTSPPVTEDKSQKSCSNVYMNVQFSGNSVSLENPYTSLQNHSRCPDYDEIRLEKSGESPTLQTSPEYEEIFPNQASSVCGADDDLSAWNFSK